MLKHIPFYASLLGKQLTPTKTSTASHVLVYGAIETHAFGERGCIASNETIAAETGLKASTVKVVISELARAKWVELEINEAGKRAQVTPLLTIAVPPPTNENPEPLATTNEPLATTNDIYKVEATVKATVNTNVELPLATRRVYDEFVKCFGKNPNQYRLSPARAAKLKVRLRDAGEDMLLTAIRNTAASDFHRGDNDRGWTADLDFIIRSYEQVEKLANMKPRGGGNAPTQADLADLQTLAIPL